MTHHDAAHHDKVSRSVRAALEQKLLGVDAPAAIIHDLPQMRERLGRIAKGFPAGTLHAIAIKANPVVGVMRELVAAGAGLEAASIEEVQLALAAGCPAQKIVFDSPAKTIAELEFAVTRGVRVNLDNEDEVRRADALAKKGLKFEAGIRVNPAVGAGTIAALSVGTASSRFGFANTPEVAQLIERHPWITSLHVHVGSQGYTAQQLAEGIGRIVDLALDINRRMGGKRLPTMDIGGGLPVMYQPDRPAPELDQYLAALRTRAPAVFDGTFQIVTEFGRWIHAPCGWAPSRVEYVKNVAGTNVCVNHLGADLLLRRAYAPSDWYHAMSILDETGKPRTGTPGLWTVAGPLCFAGDILGREIPLPPVHVGDWLVYHDIGAYTLAMWSRHCSRAIPAVLGWEGDGQPMKVLRKRETAEDVVRFWS